MGARTSAEMIEAIRLIRELGYTQYQAAKATGVSITGITRSPLFQQYLAEKAKKPSGR